MSNDSSTTETAAPGDESSTGTSAPPTTEQEATVPEWAATPSSTETAEPAESDGPPPQESTKRRWRGRSSASKVPKHDKVKDKPQKAEKAPKPVKEKKVAQEQDSATKKKRGSDFGRNVDFDLNTVRNIVGRVIWLVCLVFALALAITALFVALNANTDNEAVVRIYDFANSVDLGVFDLENPIKDFNDKEGPSEDVGTALFNYGIAAVVWLIIGRVADRVIRP